MTDRILAEAARRIEQDKQIEEAALLAGSDNDFADYKKRVGIVQGMNRALQIIADYQKDLNKNDAGTNA